MDRAALVVDISARKPAPPDDFAEDKLLEMANLDEADTNVPGTILVSTALGSHGPRVKWYPAAPGRALPCLIVSIAAEPEIRDDFLPRRVSAPIVPRLSAWIALNHVALRLFWDEGETWNRRKVADFLDGLKPLPRISR